MTVQDITNPVLADVSPKTFCVEDITAATFNGQNEPDADILEPRPDWYTIQGDDLDLDPATLFSDNCTAATSLTLHWSITDAANQPVTDEDATPLTNKTGQVSDYLANVASIVLIGDPVADEIYTITYWLEDACGNFSTNKAATITIKPRPNIVKTTIP